MASLRLRVTNGPYRGKTFSLKPGLKIGRSKGEIVIPDGKISILHAFIRANGKDLFLQDNGSKNGIFAYGQKLIQLPLRIDTVFTLGLTNFIVEPDDIEIEEISKSSAASLHMNPGPNNPVTKQDAFDDGLGELDFTKYSEGAESKPEASQASESVFELPPEAPSPAPQKIEVLAVVPEAESETKAPIEKPAESIVSDVASPIIEASPSDDVSESTAPSESLEPAEPMARHWTEFLVEFSQEVLAATKDQPRAIVALNPAIQLTFIGGPQAETQWILGYGPRKIGSAVVELPIFEANAPEVCFEILPAPDGVTFRTNHPKDVNLNGKSVKLHQLKAGDCITIGKTRIEVDVIS